MAQVIKAAVTRDPLAPNYGLKVVEFPYHEGWTLRQYIEEHFDEPEMTTVCVNLLVPESWDVVLTPDDGLLIGADLGEGFTIGGLAAFLGKLFAVWGGYVQGAGVIYSAAGISAGYAFAGAVAAVAIAAGGMLMVNALLAPDAPSRGSHSGADTSKAYQWGDVNNTAKQMIPIPIGLGTFPVAGNLIASRTESYNVNKAGYSVRETVYFLYSLVGHKISAINSVKINGMDASTFSDEDVSIYYSLGSNDQAALDPDTALSFLPSDPVAPASSGPLFPALSSETLLNAELEIPDHMVDVTETGSVLIGYSHSNYTDSFSLRASLRVALTKTESSTIYLYYLNGFSDPYTDFTGHDTPCYLALTVGDFDEFGGYLSDTEYILISSIVNGGVTGDYRYLTLTISGTREVPQAFDADSSAYIIPAVARYEKTYSMSASGSDVWDQHHYVPSSSWTAHTSGSSQIEDLELQIVLPQGLFFLYGGSHSGKGAGAKLPRWETYDFHILQKDPSSGVVLKDILFTPPDNGSSLGIIANYCTSSPGLPRGFFVYGSYPHAHTFSIKATDIVAAYADYPSLYSHPDSATQLTLDGNGYLPSGYTYQVKMRIHGHGARGRKGSMLYSTVSPSGASDNSTDVYGTRLYRVKELDYGEVLRYPDHALLAVVLNTTPTINGQMPVVIADVDFSHNYWNGSAWTQGHTKNPAHLATALCYDELMGGGVGDGDSVEVAKKVDLAKFTEFATFCSTAINDSGNPLHGEPNYLFNGIIDSQRPFWDALTEICAVANARPYFEGGTISVYWEEDAASVVQVFTSVQIKEGSFSQSYVNTVDVVEAVNGSFVDEDTGEKTAITWIFPGGKPLKNVSIELVGITNRHRALRAIQYKLNKTNTIKRACSFETTRSALNCEVGDIVAIENEFVDWGTFDFAGLTTEIDTGAVTVSLDRIWDEPSGTKYIMLRAVATDTITIYTVTGWNNTGDVSVLTVDTVTGLSAFSAMDSFLVGVGVDFYGKYLISSIDIKGDFSVTIDAIEYIEPSSLDSGMFTITATTVPEINQNNFCPRNITLTADLAETEVEVKWSPPLIAEQVIKTIRFDILRYQVWRRRGATESFELIGETETSPYIDTELVAGSHYYYKVIPIFDYYGSQAAIPLSWCSNFTDSGNQDVDDGVDFTWSVYEYLPLPTLSTHTDHPNGYLVTENAENDTLCDITVFITDPENWRHHNSSEGYQFWLRLSESNDIFDWFGPTSTTLSSSCLAGASTIVVSTVSGLTIPGLIILDSKDIVYVHSNFETTLTLGHPSYFSASDTRRKFTVGVDHSSGVSVYNAHKGFFPVRYFGFEEDVDVLTDSRQLTCDHIYRYDIPTDAIVADSDWSDIVAAGLRSVRVVYSVENIIGGMSQVTDSTFVSSSLPVPTVGDFTVNVATTDVTGRSSHLYTVVWNPVVTGFIGEVKTDKHGDLYFTLQGLPQATYCWFGVDRVLFDQPIESADFGWISHIKPVGI